MRVAMGVSMSIHGGRRALMRRASRPSGSAGDGQMGQRDIEEKKENRMGNRAILMITNFTGPSSACDTTETLATHAAFRGDDADD